MGQRWLVAALLAGLAACGTPSQAPSLGISAAEALQLRERTPPGLMNAVELDRVEGGEATSVWWGSQVSAAALQQALDDSLRGAGMLAPAAGGASYQLRVQLQGLQQPLLAAELSVTATIRYLLVNKADGRPLYQRTVSTVQRGDFGDSVLSQPDRLRRVNDAAVRENIATMLRDLIALPLR
jgi:hypothetical protein